MAEQDKNAAPSSDPFEPFRAMRDVWLDSMAKTMVETVNTEAYAQATGTMLESYLSATAPFREALEKSMTQALQHMSLPSRQEVAALAERFTSVEMRLDDLDAKLDCILDALHPSEAAAAGPGVPGQHAAAAPHEPESAAQPSRTHGAARGRGARKARR